MRGQGGNRNPAPLAHEVRAVIISGPEDTIVAKIQVPDEGSGKYDFFSLGAIVQRFDPGLVPLHESRFFERHCSGGEYNPAANLAKCFRLKTAVASACVQYPRAGGWKRK